MVDIPTRDEFAALQKAVSDTAREGDMAIARLSARIGALEALGGGIAPTPPVAEPTPAPTPTNPKPAEPAGANVSTADELIAAAAKGGQTIRLTPGSYGSVDLKQVANGVDIRGNGANFTHLGISNADSLALRDLTFNPVSSGAFPLGGLVFDNCAGGAVAGMTVIGAPRNSGDPDIWGGGMRDCQNMTLEHSLFNGGTKAFMHRGCDGITIRNTEFTGVGVDALNFSATQKVTVEDCYFHDFIHDGTRHSDCIQYYNPSGNYEPVVGVHHRRNVMLGSVGSEFQGFLVQDVPGGFYDIQWENNLLWGMLPNGLRVLHMLTADPDGAGRAPGYIRRNTAIAHPAANFGMVRIEANPTAGLDMSGNLTNRYTTETTPGATDRTVKYAGYAATFAGGSRLLETPDKLLLDDFRSLIADTGCDTDRIAPWIRDRMAERAA